MSGVTHADARARANAHVLAYAVRSTVCELWGEQDPLPDSAGWSKADQQVLPAGQDRLTRNLEAVPACNVHQVSGNAFLAGEPRFVPSQKCGVDARDGHEVAQQSGDGFHCNGFAFILFTGRNPL